MISFISIVNVLLFLLFILGTGMAVSGILRALFLFVKRVSQSESYNNNWRSLLKKGLLVMLITSGVWLLGNLLVRTFFPAPFDSEPCSWGCPPALVGTADWKKYSNTDYGISFDYPASWSPLRVDQATEQDLPMAMKYTILSFNKSLEINIDLSKYGNYKNPSYISDVQRLKEIFTTKKSRETDTLWLPPQPAAIVSHTPVQYIETPNGIFRGVYYFARINQNDDFTISDELHNLVVVLSDGKSTIFQVMVGNSGRSMKPGSAFQTLNQCNDIFHRTKCIIDKDFYSSFDTVYKQMLTNLHSL